jgi:uncharacterized protein YqgC (DUF456 family)
MDTRTILWFPAVVLIITGLIGLVFPALPGVILLLAGLVVAAWAENFVYVGWGTISILVILSAFAYGIFFGLPGILVGPFLGSVLGELSVRRDLQAAGRAGVGAWLGLVLGAAVKIATAFTMVGVFACARFL